MGVFEDALVTIKSAANVAVEKTEKVIDVSKLRINAAEINSKLSKCFEELGKLQYTSVKNSTENDEAKELCIARLDQLYAKLKNINEQLNETDNKIVCKNCGCSNDSKMSYCGKCGSVITVAENIVEDEDIEEIKF